MKPWWINALIVLLVGAIAFVVTSTFLTHEKVEQMKQPEAELLWLRSAFDLDEASYQKIAALHRKFQPACVQMCDELMASDRKIDRIMTHSEGMTPQLQQALDDAAALDLRCRKHLIHHIYEIAACMKPEQGRRYVELMRSRMSPHPTVQQMLDHGHEQIP